MNRIIDQKKAHLQNFYARKWKEDSKRHKPVFLIFTTQSWNKEKVWEHRVSAWFMEEAISFVRFQFLGHDIIRVETTSQTVWA